MPRPITDVAKIGVRLMHVLDAAADAFNAASIDMRGARRFMQFVPAKSERDALRAADRCLVLRRHMDRLLGSGDVVILSAQMYPTARGLRVVAGYLERQGFTSCANILRDLATERVEMARERMRARGLLRASVPRDGKEAPYPPNGVTG